MLPDTFMRTPILRFPYHREDVLWHKLTGGLRRRWANKPLDFPEALEAFRTAIRCTINAP
jgi:hypothetical protein